jgi:hypothetical protein
MPNVLRKSGSREEQPIPDITFTPSGAMSRSSKHSVSAESTAK